MSNRLSLQKAAHEWVLYLFLAPSLFFIVIFAYFPTASAIYHSFFDWQGGDVKEFVAWDNFRRVLSDRIFWDSFVTVLILMLANLVKMIPSVAVAVAIHRMVSVRWQYWYRVLLVLPMIVPGLVTLFIWKFFFHPQMGLVNKLLDFTGIKSSLIWLDSTVLHWQLFTDRPLAWLNQEELIIPALIIWGFPWIGAVGVLIFLAGLQSIGTEIYEAAELDGVNWFQKFWHIEFPLIMTQIRLMLILMSVGTLSGYGLQMLLLGTNGGAGGRGMVPGLWMFNRAFVAGEFGYACALGIFLFAFILGATLINNKLAKNRK